ncbi:unnamed protein product [Phytophthora lilii]|uniref:Unnamed protein product n=1 Tax=Phytophthora lilii TaxID=2077276 RepID=A0A9W6UDU8_9STRA|nr:unnamed protein product [Phytophthora lilii]
MDELRLRFPVDAMMKDIEHGYELHASPKPGSVQDAGDTSVPSHPSIWLLLVISMPRMAIQMAWAAQWAALGPYLSTMLPRYAVQITQFIGPIAGVLVAPSVGVFSDRSTMKMGQRRPFLIVAGILSIVCWIAMGYTREMGEALGDHGDGTDGEETDRKWTSVLTVFFYLWMDITVNVVQTPAMLLVADFAGDRQTTGAALGQAWATLGAILIAGYIAFFEAAYKSLHWFMGMLSVTMFVCVGVAVIFAKETPLSPSAVDNGSLCARVTHAFASVPEQDAYNHGVSVAGGRADLLYNVLRYVWAWGMPFMVHKIGVKWVLTISTLPQVLFTAMAWVSNPGFNIFVVAMSGITHAVWFALVVPVIIHVFGEQEDIGVFAGALKLGQLLWSTP